MRVEELNLDLDGDIESRVRQAINLLEDLSGFDGAHHKQYAIDQAIRLLLEDEDGLNYKRWRESRPDWDEGIAP